MKTIFVPTDFSDNAKNAVRFAILLAQKQDAELILHHSYLLPVPIAEIPFDVLQAEKENLVEESQRMLKTHAIELDHAGIKNYQFSICEGDPSDTIIEKSKEKGAELIIMGTRGASGIADDFFGTNTAIVIEGASCPVLAVPEGWRFSKAIKVITYATDYHNSDLAALNNLVKFAGLFNAQINILHIGTDEMTPEEELETMNVFKKRVTGNIAYFNLSFQVMHGGDVEEKLETYLAEGGTDMLVMSTHKRKFFEKIFKKSLAREIVENSQIPILAYHYDKKLLNKIILM